MDVSFRSNNYPVNDLATPVKWKTQNEWKKLLVKFVYLANNVYYVWNISTFMWKIEIYLHESKYVFI